jgi:hypothetical protein
MPGSELQILPRAPLFPPAFERALLNLHGEPGVQAVFALKPALRLDCSVLTSTFHLAVDVHAMENDSIGHWLPACLGSALH